MPTLTFENGPSAGKQIRIKPGRECVLGRSNGDETVDDSEVSRRHAALRLENGQIVVEDLESLNGTWVNEERIITPRILGQGDKVRLGTTVFSVGVEPGGAAELPASVNVSAVMAQPLPALAVDAVELPPDPFRPLDDGSAATHRTVASRRFGPLVFSATVTVVTAIALVLYFATR